MSTLLGPDQAQGLRNLLGNIHTSPARIIAVTSGKGGVGKSNICLNLAIAIANMKDPSNQMPMNKKVVIMDADLGLANINVLMGVIPRYNLLHVMSGEKSLKDILVQTDFGVSLIAGASGFAQLANLQHQEIERFLKGLLELQDMDYILIDTAAGISDHVLQFALAADEAIVVTTPEPTSITDAYGMIKSLSAYEQAPPMKVIVNRTKDLTEGGKVSAKIIEISEKFLNTKVENLGFVYHETSIPEAVRRQVPFSVLDPQSNASLCIKHIAKRILNLETRSESGGWKRFIHTIFQMSGSAEE